MAEIENAPVVGEIPTETETVPAASDETKKEESVSSKTPEELAREEEEKEESSDIKAKFKAARDERDAQKKAARESKEEAEKLRRELSLRDEKEKEVKGEFRELAETRLQKIQVLENQNVELTNKLESFNETVIKENKNYNKTLNDMIDIAIQSWPEKAKAPIGNGKDVSAIERFNQYKAIQPLVEDFLKSSGKPGAGPSPHDSREQGNEKDTSVLTANKLRGTNMYSG